jgi:uncharacterized protein (DUF779 family)
MELACNDDTDLSSSSHVTLELEAGETVYVVVESYWGTTGRFVVNIHEALEQECSDKRDDDDDDLIDCADPDCDCECPVGVLSSTPFSGSTAGGHDFGAGSCGGDGAPDLSLVWTPPSTGRYRISAEGVSFGTVLYVQEGDVCGGAELACNDDDLFGSDSAVELALDGGMPVIITVDGFGAGAGEYVLDITALPELDCADGNDEDEDGAVDCEDDDCDCTCPLEHLGSVLGPAVYAGSTAARSDLGPGSCGGDGAADASFVWTAPKAGAFRIDTAGSSFDTLLRVQQGNVCGGAEIACDDDTGPGLTSEIALVLAAGESIVITVDGGLPGALGDFVLNIAEVPETSCADGDDEDEDGAVDCDDSDCDCTCPMADLGDAPGEPVFQGSTALRGNLDSGTCGGSSGPDASFVWTAPETGDYRIHTGGSSFDTVLYVQEGDVCGGAELACNDDTEGSLSQVELGLTAGQTVVITVDGFFDFSAGSFELGIECLTCS